MSELLMHCDQCSMSGPAGCGSKGQSMGTCGKTDTLAHLQDMMIYGLKGMSAYRYHANEMGADTKEIDDVAQETLYFTLTNVNFNFNEHIAQLMKIGDAGVKVMGALSEAHTNTLGIPTPVTVTQNKAEGKAILVSGHNMLMMKKLLEATKDKGINVYTHSEMLTAMSYPELKKYPHLKGNIGKSWFDQRKLFAKWQGTIVLNTNCIMTIKDDAAYADRIYTTSIAGIDQAKKIENYDFSALIEQTLSLPDITGFDEDTTIQTGHHYKTILTLAPAVVEAVKAGKIKRFFVVAGCDSPGSGGNYYRELAQKIPKDCVILTSSCGKFRFNDIDFGNVPGTEIPRYLDLGQCNDSNGAVAIALALAEAFDCGVNELPLSIVLSWMEQKAVLILLALFNLGVQNIYLGPRPPQFVNGAIVDFLVENFNFKLTSDAETDLKAMLS